VGRFSGSTAWARNLTAPLRDFLNTETGGAIALLAATLAALAWANISPHSYESAWTTKLQVLLGHHGISQDLRGWVNKGLMTFFFLVAGLEAKRELSIGQLRERQRVALPVLASLGGMTVPIVIFLAFNAGGPGAHGWGASMSTDTAFALGVLALVAPGGTRLRVRLLTIAVVDDLVALIVIATAYTSHLSIMPLLIGLGAFGLLIAARALPPQYRGATAAALGVVLWVSLYKSGIDPVISGLAAGLVTSAYPPERGGLERVVELTRSFREQPTPELALSTQRSVASAISPNDRLQYRLHPWTSFVIVPLFALANAGIHVTGAALSHAFSSPITWGIIVGYVAGKPLGILGGTALGQRLGRGLRRSLSWPVIAGGGAVAGIGFTVSLLISTIAFHGQNLADAKIGVLTAALLATLGSWLVFQVIRRLPAELRARQVAETIEELVDLSDDVDPERDHIRGGDEAVVTLVEYGDYECPYCGQAEVVVRELLESFGDDLRYVWRHLPLNDVHPNAQLAAEAAEAAAAQGEFWGMHDKLLAHQEELSPRDLGRYAEELGLDLDRFWDGLKRHAHAERVEEDVESADASGVAGTPSFFINGKRHSGAYDVATLTAAVRGARWRADLLRRSAAAAT
jgi:Na+/H+ antiporter NhaA